MMRTTWKTLRRGFTLVEAMIAGTITVVVIGTAMIFFVDELKHWQRMSVQNELNINLELSMEKLRRDLRCRIRAIRKWRFIRH